MFVLPTSCIRLDTAGHLSPESIHLISGLAPQTQYLAAAVVSVHRYLYDLELDTYLHTTCDESCPHVVVLRGLASSPFALQEDDSPADLERVRPNPETLIVLFRCHTSTEHDTVANKSHALHQRIPGSSLHLYSRLVRVTEFETDAVLVHDVIVFPKQRPVQTQITSESLWVTINAVASQKGHVLGPWGFDTILWYVWQELIATEAPYPPLSWCIEDEIPHCLQTKLLRKQSVFEFDPVLRQSYISSIDPAVRSVIESVLERGVETSESKARREMRLVAQSFGLVDGDLITADIVKAELQEFQESSNL